MEHPKVIVIGGGYAGVMAANRLTKRKDVSVTLVNPRPKFVERIRLHQLVGGSDDAVVDFEHVLSDRVRLVVDSVNEIDRSTRTLHLDSGEDLHWDYLVYAVGSGSAVGGVPGAATHAYPLASAEEADRLGVALGRLSAADAITVVGGGPLGIETAAELGESGRSVTLVCGGELGPYLHPRARRTVATRLARLGVQVVDGEGSRVNEVLPDSVVLADGRELPSALTVWAAGFGVPDLARRSGFTTDDLGRMLTDETLTSVDEERVVAAGDAGAPSDRPYRMSCQAASQLGPSAAETVLSRIDGRPAEPVGLGFVSLCMSLGRHAGIAQLSNADDTAKSSYISGWAGARVKELICSGTVLGMRLESKRPGIIAYPSWVKDSKRQDVLTENSDLASTAAPRAS